MGSLQSAWAKKCLRTGWRDRWREWIPGFVCVRRRMLRFLELFREQEGNVDWISSLGNIAQFSCSEDITVIPERAPTSNTCSEAACARDVKWCYFPFVRGSELLLSSSKRAYVAQRVGVCSQVTSRCICNFGLTITRVKDLKLSTLANFFCPL